MGRTIGNIRGPRQPLRCQRNQVTEGRIWPSGSSNRAKARTDLIYSPPLPEFGTDAVAAPRMVSVVVTSGLGWPGAGLLQLRTQPGDISGGVARTNIARGGCSLARGNVVLVWEAVVLSTQNFKKRCAARLSAWSTQCCSLPVKSLRQHLLVLIII